MNERDKKAHQVKHSESPQTLTATTEIDAQHRNDKPATGAAESKEVLVPHHCTLDGFAEVALANEGLDVAGLEPLTPLHVQTENTLYQLTLLDPLASEVLVQGGSFFVMPTKATLCGSSFGGSFLKSRWAGAGMRMEICGEGRNIVPSPVRSIRIENDESLPGPF